MRISDWSSDVCSSDLTASIKIVAGQTVRHDAALILSTRADQDAEIVVTAGVLEGDARAIMDQRQSMDIKNILSFESYGDISYGNPSEFLTYIPGLDPAGAGPSVTTVQFRGLPSPMIC